MFTQEDKDDVSNGSAFNTIDKMFIKINHSNLQDNNLSQKEKNDPISLNLPPSARNYTARNTRFKKVVQTARLQKKETGGL